MNSHPDIFLSDEIIFSLFRKKMNEVSSNRDDTKVLHATKEQMRGKQNKKNFSYFLDFGLTVT